MVPGQTGFYFYGGYWYRVWEGRWYRAGFYNGPWGYVDVGVVPGVIVSVPPEYPLFLAPGYHRIHYGDLYGHWRGWDHDRYWHRQEWFRHEMRSDVIREHHLRAEHERVRIHERERARFGSGTHAVDHGRTTTTRTTTIDRGKGNATVTKSTTVDHSKGHTTVTKSTLVNVNKGQGNNSTTNVKKHTTTTTQQGQGVRSTTRTTTVQHTSNQGNKSTQHSGDSHNKGDHH
jgi:hypothetical protein